MYLFDIKLGLVTDGALWAGLNAVLHSNERL